MSTIQNTLLKTIQIVKYLYINDLAQMNSCVLVVHRSPYESLPSAH